MKHKTSRVLGNKEKRELRDKIINDIEMFNIPRKELIINLNISMSTLQRIFTVNSNVPWSKTLLAIDDYIEYNYRSNDAERKKLIEVDGILFSKSKFLRAFFDHYEEFREYQEFKFFEDSIRKDIKIKLQDSQTPS